MLTKQTKSILIGFLACSLIIGPAAPGFAKPKDVKKVRIAFLPPSFENVDERTQENLLRRLHDIFKNEPTLQIINPEAFTPGYQNGFSSSLDSTAIFEYATDKQIDYVFRADFANQSRDDKRILLVGELQRYDLATKNIHSFEILKYYENIGIDLQHFRDEFVKTIILENSKRRNLLPVLVIGGVALAGILALTLSFTGVSATGNGSNDRGGRTP